MKSIEVRHKLTNWQWVFLQSKVNGAAYNGEALPGQVWSCRKTHTCNSEWSAINI